MVSEAKARARARRHRYALCTNVGLTGSLRTPCHRLVVVGVTPAAVCVILWPTCSRSNGFV